MLDNKQNPEPLPPLPFTGWIVIFCIILVIWSVNSWALGVNIPAGSDTIGSTPMGKACVGAQSEGDAKNCVGSVVKKTLYGFLGSSTVGTGSYSSLSSAIDQELAGSDSTGLTLGSTPGGSGDTVKTLSFSDTDHVKALNRTIQEKWFPAFVAMQKQLSISMFNQIFAVGPLIDAKTQSETQQVFQELAAEAHRDYQTDTTMCAIGTNVRSLAAGEAVAKVNSRALDLTMAKREMLSGDQGASSGNAADINQRWAQFKQLYCDPYDAGKNLSSICLPTAGRDATRINRDISYTRTVEGQYTLNADFTNSADSPDKEDVIALSRNLFAFHTFNVIPAIFLTEDFSHDIYQDMRSVEAMRSVARNSFAHIVGMRASGTPLANNVTPFMQAVLLQMGVPATEVNKFLGANPSYFAQMEVLTHKIYEQPEFYSNLYTTPANVGRIGVSIQALRLMQDRDRYESALRREMLVSLLLELQINNRQETTTGNFLRTTDSLMNKLAQ